VLPLAPSFDTVGLLAKDPDILRRASGVLLPQSTPAPVTSLLAAEDLLDISPAMRIAFVAGVRALTGHADLALRLVPALCGGQRERWFAAFRTVQAAEAWQAHGAWLEQHPGSVDPVVAARFAAGKNVTDEEKASAAGILADARKVLLDAVRPGTALVLPASSSVAPPRDLPDGAGEDVRAATLRLTFLASLAGLPAVVAPVLRVGALPAGLCLAGAPGSDRALLNMLS
jgi:Asp-tRNA(Asn)/Glu-tRNA(Gln) amidotransferase A subunit family amidase